MSFRYLLVDEHWTHIGWFDAEVPDWSVGQEITTDDGRTFAITGIVPNLDTGRDHVGTWTVEPA